MAVIWMACYRQRVARAVPADVHSPAVSRLPERCGCGALTGRPFGMRLSVAVDIAKRYPFTAEDWAAASVLRKLNLAVEVLAGHHEYGGLCAGCLAHCRQPDCVGCVWHKSCPCPLASIAQAALCLPVPGVEG
jgi:hypothetical protein